MTKFRADWDSDTELEVGLEETLPPSSPPRNDSRRATVEDYSSGSDEDELQEEEFMQTSPSRGPVAAQALVQDDDGEYVHAHEAGIHEPSPESWDSERDFDANKENERRVTTEPIPWAATVGVEPHRLHVMQQSFFHTQPQPPSTQPPSRYPISISKGRTPTPQNATPSATQTNGKRTIRPSDFNPTVENGERSSFGNNLLNPPKRPARKYAKVTPQVSLTAGHEGSLVDLGLSMSRSFRVSWGPGGTLAHFGTICGPKDTSNYASSSVITVEKLKISPVDDDDERDRSSDLLSLLSRQTEVSIDQGIPSASALQSLRFNDFASIFPTSDTSPEANLWRLGVALFDELDLLDPNVSVQVFQRIYQIRRKDAVSQWLEGACRSAVDSDFGSLRGSGNVAKQILTLLTGNQVERAVELAVDGKFVQLSTLLSQSGDATFRDSLRDQITIWREQRVNAHISPEVLTLYELLAGMTIAEGARGPLDWKRAFGLRLWFGDTLDVDAGLVDVVEEYERLAENSSCPSPTPWYIESPPSSPLARTLRRPSSTISVLDAQFLMIKLFTDPSLSFDELLSPLPYSPSPLDSRLPFFMYILLSGILPDRDISDRQTSSAGAVRGSSMIAGQVIEGYATMLENVDSIKEAAFVLMFLESGAGRKKSIVELLSRNAHLIDEELEEALLVLQIPIQWINEAKATYHLYQGEIYEGYEAALKGGLQNLAHDLAVQRLAPEVVMRDDMRLLRHLFARFTPKLVNGWSTRGKLYLDYATLMIALDQQAEATRAAEPEAVPDAVEAAELSRLALELPKLIPNLPDVGGRNPALLHRAAVQRMSNELAKREAGLKKLGLDNITLGKGAVLLLDNETRLANAKSKAIHRFMQSVEAAAS
ncbi:hypothetical protein SISSUDRAFT_1122717 [Sistotremastrum suecicum HHB10207 ss-3]|uniref:Nuclear pore complex protein NUP96 C-terminal domain-containing protein n=1 Tax=Sistotremastrum suecicum HHB10207 ss-3 TaxID=1314776 RepID=A0A165YXK0_9AGAM|nr:hypothetical protein SISSUDRAFT_1122717 [Sistotremastrum suecicum HHB10207 ss-3]